MADQTSERQIISGSSWWIWVLLAVGVFVIVMLIYGGWRLFRGATQAVRNEVPEQVSARRENTVRFVRTPTEVIVIDDPIIPEGEVAVEAIVKNFETYQGDTVVISGSVRDFESATYFVLDQGEDAIRILGLPEVTEENDLENNPSAASQYVRITGVVKLLTKEREKTEFGLRYRDIDEAFWQDQMIIEAQTIEVISPSTI
ncbi:MAG: hypothetical protein QG639_996 [Patescibacteria group bacterium]|jgi:hypothetical protein|nr:hypothetical protein [Patescibacteria group bacterium]